MLAPLSNYRGGGVGAEGWPPSSYAYGFHTFVPIFRLITLYIIFIINKLENLLRHLTIKRFYCPKRK